ncbi:TPA: MoxR family ATPase [Candidatus Woesearchaeota archaeon]|nr:MoxR family ATPase [Candidatus Woesearchaeota archaeon]HIH47776.1 MoxR family ATPase [Candidatus Woesearchaeota archaeon]
MKNYEKIFDGFFSNMNKVIIGQNEMIEEILIAMLCNANGLVEGYPGLAKTLTVKTIAELMDMSFSRIQNTPDLMPSDITGTYIIDEIDGRRQFKFQKGPIFANILLADEINRATPKTQSALLEAMQEKQVTVGNTTFKLDEPFFVLATQNPIEQEGTFPLPEAQADRFLLKIKVGYPAVEDEIKIVERFTGEESIPKLSPIIDKKVFIALQNLSRRVPIANELKQKIVKLIDTTRHNKKLIEYGASPRASIGLILASKARAFIKGRTHVSSEDIVKMAFPILRHRIILNFEAEKEGLSTDDVITELLTK